MRMPPPAPRLTRRSALRSLRMGLVFLGLAVLAPMALAQEVDTTRTAPADTTQAAPAPDQPTPPPQQAAPEGSSSLDAPVEFAARDSLVFIFEENGNDIATLFGEATVSYDETTLKAYAVDVLFERDELHARGLRTDTGYVGLPQFSEGDEPFSGIELAYNLRTERGRVVQGRTSLDDGFIAADVAKVTEDSTLYIQDGSYTTCDCPPGETPSYSLRSQKMKIVDQERIFTGPIQLYIFNIPTPLWLPFGFLPAKEGRRSGPLPPQYGEDERGFYLRGWGWYQAINEYMDLQVQAGIWSKGSWQINPIFRYNRRYRYDGRLNIDYLRELSGERDDPDVIIQRRASLRWSHNQTISPTSTLRADIDLTSSGYLRTVSEQYEDNVRQQVTSSINYSKQWQQAGRSLSINARQSQTLSTGAANLTLPSLNLRQSSRRPFERDRRAPGQDERWYEKLTVSYSGSADNRYRFEPLDEDELAARGDTAAADISWYEALVDPDKYRRATGEDNRFDFEASHRVPLSMPFTLNRVPLTQRRLRLNLTPNATYTEDWFLRTERRQVDTTGTVVREDVSGFFALRQFTTGLSANTTFYGIFPVGVGPYQGVRHTVRPTLSANYTPDFRSDRWGYTRTFTTAEGEEQRYPIVSGVSSEQRSLSLRLSNVFETRRVPTDTTQQSQSRTLKLFNVDASTSYNFAADSLKLSDIRLSGRTRI
ncbi:MAG: LPS-assembly protein LptD, partial [Bacteroidetes bacterium]|nr:LPS-assembly protein LptD [Bacteroidota bacterium]